MKILIKKKPVEATAAKYSHTDAKQDKKSGIHKQMVKTHAPARSRESTIRKLLTPKTRKHYARQIERGEYGHEITKHLRAAQKAKELHSITYLTPEGKNRKKRYARQYHKAMVGAHNAFVKPHMASLRMHMQKHNKLEARPEKHMRMLK